MQGEKATEEKMGHTFGKLSRCGEEREKERGWEENRILIPERRDEFLGMKNCCDENNPMTRANIPKP